MPPQQAGWLTKKNQRRWCALQDSVLYWFHGIQNSGADLQRLASGSLNLRACVLLCTHPARALSIQITTETKTVYWKADSDEEFLAWFCALKAAMYRSHAQVSVGPVSPEIMSGTLTKKGATRHFVLKDGNLSWYQTKESGSSNGELDLSLCVIDYVPDTNTFTVKASYSHKQYTMTCTEGIEKTKAWVNAIREVIDAKKSEEEATTGQDSVQASTGPITKRGWLEKRKKDYFFVLNNRLLAWYSNEPSSDQKSAANICGSMNLSGAQLSRLGFSLIIRPTVGSIVTLIASDLRDVQEWLEVLKAAAALKNLNNTTDTLEIGKLEKLAGWVKKKYIGEKKTHKRFLYAKKSDFTMKYYDSDNIETATPKGEIVLAGASVNQMDSETFVVSTAHGRDYPFVCEIPDVTSSWVAMLALMIKEATKKVDQAVYKHQWMVGGKTAQGDRWVVLTFQRELMWFDKVVSPENINAANSHAVINLNDAQIEKHPTIISGSGQTATFFPPDEYSYQDWFQEIIGASGGTGKLKPRSKTFGVPLHVLQQREQSEIPKVVLACTNFIEAHERTQGIFRLSGATSEIQEYTDVLDEGLDLELPATADINAVAGLLKLFFRELPEPVLQMELYPEFVAAVDDALSAIVLKLAPPNYYLAKYLFSFLHNLAKSSEITSMDENNLAIVFAPNLLRGSSDCDPTVRLKETSIVQMVAKEMIEKYDVLFNDTYLQ